MKEIFERVFEAAECRTPIELADTLDVQQSFISDAKRRNSIPSDWLIKLLRLKQINPDWILTGQGSRFMVPSDSPDMAFHVVYLTETKPPEQCSAQDLINELVTHSRTCVDKHSQFFALQIERKHSGIPKRPWLRSSLLHSDRRPTPSLPD